MTPSLATAQVAAAHLTPGDTIVIEGSRYAVVCREPRWHDPTNGLTYLALDREMASQPPQVNYLGVATYEMPDALLLTVVRREE